MDLLNEIEKDIADEHQSLDPMFDPNGYFSDPNISCRDYPNLLKLIDLYDLSEEFKKPEMNEHAKIIHKELEDIIDSEYDDLDPEHPVIPLTAICVHFYTKYNFVPKFESYSKLISEIEKRQSFLTPNFLEFISVCYDNKSLGFDHYVPITRKGYIQVFDYYIKNINIPAFTVMFSFVQALRTLQEDAQTDDNYLLVPKSLITNILDLPCMKITE